MVPKIEEGEALIKEQPPRSPVMSRFSSMRKEKVRAKLSGNSSFVSAEWVCAAG